MDNMYIIHFTNKILPQISFRIWLQFLSSLFSFLFSLFLHLSALIIFSLFTET